MLWFRRMSVHGSPPIPVIVLNDTRVDQHHGCSRVMSAIESLLTQVGGQIVACVPAHTDWRVNPYLLATAASARLVLVNGEGTIHHDRPAGRLLLEAGAWAKSRGIPVALVNAGWEDNGHDFLRLARDFSLVAVRDTRSAMQLREGGVACRIVPDLSLYGSSSRHATMPRAGTVFTDSVDRAATVRLDLLRRRLAADFLPIQFGNPGLRGSYQFVRGGIGFGDLAHPIFAMRMIRARRSLLRRQVPDPDRFVEKLARRELLVSGRFHACTLALKAGTPFVAIASNTAKISALVEAAGLAPWRVDASLAPTDIESARSQGWLPCELDAISAYLSDAKSEAEGLFADIRRLT